jgi:hypothetical protein
MPGEKDYEEIKDMYIEKQKKNWEVVFHFLNYIFFFTP